MIAITTTATTPQTLSLWLSGRIVPKSRPRFARNQVYLLPKYRQWQQAAVLEMLSQLSDRASLPLARASVEILLTGGHRGDLDNLSGSILDALVQARVLLDDRLSCVPKLVVQHNPKGELGVTILIEEIFC